MVIMLWLWNMYRLVVVPFMSNRIVTSLKLTKFECSVGISMIILMTQGNPAIRLIGNKTCCVSLEFKSMSFNKYSTIFLVLEVPSRVYLSFKAECNFKEATIIGFPSVGAGTWAGSSIVTTWVSGSISCEKKRVNRLDRGNNKDPNLPVLHLQERENEDALKNQ